VLSALAVACASQPRPEPVQERQVVRAVSPTPSHLEPKQPLPPLARSFLKSRMANHARSMTDLVTAIMVLDYAAIHSGARAIAEDVDLARPLTTDASELNAQLPERFFDYQDDLRKNARALAGAADRLDALGVADAYGRLSESCVRCHAAYRAGR
jgi:cytochrome c556